jgi:Xaa-Pro aminopeptidase
MCHAERSSECSRSARTSAASRNEDETLSGNYEFNYNGTMTPLLVGNLTNIRYLTGLDMTAGLMLLTQKKRFLFVDDRYSEKAGKETSRNITVLHMDELETRMQKFKRVRFESNEITYARLVRWKKRFQATKLVPSENVIEELRRKKRKDEIKAIHKACRITDVILKNVPAFLKPGVTEKEVAWKIESEAKKRGADDMAFETIVAFGEHTSRPHHRPTKRKLKKGDLVQIDMGVKVNGYCSDCSRVFFTTNPTPDQKKVFDLLIQLVKETTKMMKPGTLNTALDRHARNALKKKGFGDNFLHSLGHGVGLEVHEGINLSSRVQGKMKKKILRNEVLTTEPGVYFAGKWGMRIEDTILVTAKGGMRLSKAPYKFLH